jgi:integrase
MTKSLMGWNASQKRWFKRIPKGLPQAGSMVALGRGKLEEAFPGAVRNWNKEETLRLANDWWRNYEANLRTMDAPENTIAKLSDEINVLHAESLSVKAKIRQLNEVDAGLRKELVASVLDASGVSWAKTLGLPIPKVSERNINPKSLTALAHLFVSTKAKATRNGRAKSLTGGRIDNVRNYLKRLVSAVGNLDIEEVSEQVVRAYFDHLDDGGKSKSTAKDYFSTFRQFLRWTYEEGYRQASLPRNLMSKEFSFTPELKTPNPFTKAEIAESLDVLEAEISCAVSPRDKLAMRQLKASVLLRVNCGLSTQDIANLKWSDIEAGTLTYKRNKLMRFPNLEPVAYRLWSETLAALSDLEHTGTLVFSTLKGRAIYRSVLNADNSYTRSDNQGHLWSHKRTIKKPLKAFRKSGAETMTNLGFGDCVDRFLQHTPADMTRKHYTTGKTNNFEEAVMAVGKELGLG